MVPGREEEFILVESGICDCFFQKMNQVISSCVASGVLANLLSEFVHDDVFSDESTRKETGYREYLASIQASKAVADVI